MIHFNLATGWFFVCLVASVVVIGNVLPPLGLSWWWSLIIFVVGALPIGWMFIRLFFAMRSYQEYPH
ncbi:MAG: hypothetical protein P9E24_01270 [Candidatus Competibacter sp.]|nr:hypothetical protein [Candidatus Competibacter sp.]MDG4583382.1 hypothetical protein [Candidatus Competibacter sp.]